MSEIAHNHPPRCCCALNETLSNGSGRYTICPLCTEHGELAQLAQPQPCECPVCHSEIGKQHTDYCPFPGTVSPLEIPIKVITDATIRSATPDGRVSLTDVHTQTSTPTTHARTELDRATLDAALTGNGYLLNGRRIPPEDVTVVHREPTPTTQDTPSPECPVCFGPRNQPPRPACSTPTAHDTPR